MKLPIMFMINDFITNLIMQDYEEHYKNILMFGRSIVTIDKYKFIYILEKDIKND